jgi:hypothetical protein
MLVGLIRREVTYAKPECERRRVTDVPAKEISAMARAIVEANPALLAKAKASGVVQDELARLYAKEATKLLRKLARKSKHSHRT